MKSDTRFAVMYQRFSGDDRVAIGEQGKDELQDLCDVLNSTETPERRSILREFIKRWQQSGPDLCSMMYGDLPLFGELQQACKVRWVPQSDGRAVLCISPDIGRGKAAKLRQVNDGTWEPTPRAEALAWFYFLTVNPEWDQLAGPCSRCGDYYVKKRASQKVYCSRQCGNASTAVVRTRARLKAERDQKMHLARAAIRQWNALKPRPTLDWATWLKKRHADISPKFVTRWVNKGLLQTPRFIGQPQSKGAK